MTPEQLAKQFTYHKPHGDQPARYENIRCHAGALAEVILNSVPDSREKSLAFTKLKEAVMWANAAIAINEADEPVEKTLPGDLESKG